MTLNDPTDADDEKICAVLRAVQRSPQRSPSPQSSPSPANKRK